MTTTTNRPNVAGHIGRVGAVIAIAVALCALSAAAQTAKEVKGATPLVAVPNEAPAKLIVDPAHSRAAGPGARLHPVPDRKPAHPAGVRQRRPGGIATPRTPSLLRGWPVVADRRLERRNGGPRRTATGSAQGPARIGGCDAQTDPRRHPTGGVHRSPSAVAPVNVWSADVFSRGR